MELRAKSAKLGVFQSLLRLKRPELAFPSLLHQTIRAVDREPDEEHHHPAHHREERDEEPRDLRGGEGDRLDARDDADMHDRDDETCGKDPPREGSGPEGEPIPAQEKMAGPVGQRDATRRREQRHQQRGEESLVLRDDLADRDEDVERPPHGLTDPVCARRTWHDPTGYLRAFLAERAGAVELFFAG